MSASMSQLIEAYNDQRAALIDADRALRVDRIRGPYHTVLEIKADQIVRSIRAEEARTVWGVEHDDVPSPFPGMEFITGKKIVVKTKLFQLLSKMPKGALLHTHVDLSVSPRATLDIALHHPAIHIQVPPALTTSNLASTVPRVMPQASDFSACTVALTDPNYPGDSWVPLRFARESFSPNMGGPEGFDKWLTESMSISSIAAYDTHNNNIKIWDKFAESAKLVCGMTHYAPMWPEYIKQFFKEIVEDGISYAECRFDFTPKHFMDAEGQDTATHLQWIKVFRDVAKEYKEELQAQGRGDEFAGAKMIYTVIRRVTPGELEWYLQDCIAMKQEFPDVIAGFDLVGDENANRPLIYYLSPLLTFRAECDSLSLDIPFLFHAGETCGDGSHADVNLYDALLLGSKRIAHGFSIVKHPKLMEMCRERNVALEVCPISNEILRLTASMPMHPLPILLNNGVPVTLNSDDGTLFNNVGITYDMYQVIAASDVTGLLTLAELARDSITHSMMSEDEKKMAREAWEKRWILFLENVVSLEAQTGVDAPLRN